jgi:hypothetical protein
MSESLREPRPFGLGPAAEPPERYEPIHPGSGRPPLRKRLARYLAPPVLLAAKAKTLLFLLPVVPLDGGRAAAALSPAVWLAGLAGCSSSPSSTRARS